MKRVNQFARLAVVFIFIAVSAVAQSGLPRLTISIYAVEPKDAPLRITNFQYRQGSIDLVMHNDSAKIVTDFSIYAWVATPPGCPVEENQNGKPSRHAWLGRNIHLTIKPQETVTLTRQYQDVVLSPGRLSRQLTPYNTRSYTCKQELAQFILLMAASGVPERPEI